jgi:iron complex outermembrane receptor protein
MGTLKMKAFVTGIGCGLLAAGTIAPAAETAGATDNSASGALSEIVVTAEKRSARLQDVPVPVTAISAETLLQSNQVQLQDYYSSIPGVNLTPGGFGPQTYLVIRGLASGGGNGTVGTLVDDVPIGGSTFANATTFIPEIDPSELSQVEVLRGPQGTLYGASSIGGLIKFVTVDPSTEKMVASMQL